MEAVSIYNICVASYQPLWPLVLLTPVKQVSVLIFLFWTTWKGLYFSDKIWYPDSDMLGFHHEDPEKHAKEFAFYTLMLGTLYLSKVSGRSVDTGLEKPKKAHREQQILP